MVTLKPTTIAMDAFRLSVARCLVYGTKQPPQISIGDHDAETNIENHKNLPARFVLNNAATSLQHFNIAYCCVVI